MSNIASNDYPDFSSITTYEVLSIAIARKILDYQQDSSLNPDGLTVITIETDENADTISISATVRGRFRLGSGDIEVEDRFPSSGFQIGTGAYSFNGLNILEAFFYLIQYQHTLELNPINNQNAENQFCSFSIASATEVGSQWPLDITIEQNNAPLIITNSNGESISKGKVYLL